MTATPLVKKSHRRAERLKALLPDVWVLIAPHRRVLAFGMLLIATGRLAGLVTPVATKYLIDDVLGKHRIDLLPRLVLVVTLATLVQAGTSYVLAQVFSRSTNRLMAALRCKLHSHVVRLPLLYHDANKSGAVGSRVMNDVTGLQNLVGTGLIGFAGSLMTAGIAVAIMARYSFLLSAVTSVCVTIVGVLVGVSTHRTRAIAYERAELFSDIAGRLAEALGGVRVLKAYRAEAREDAIFADGMARMVENSLKSTNFSSGMSLGTTVLWGIVNAVVMFAGAQRILAGELTLGGFFTITVLLNYMAAPLFQIIGIGSMLMEALAGLERTRQILQVQPEDRDPKRAAEVGALRGEVVFDHVGFAYEEGKAVLHDVSFRAAPGTVTALVGPSGSGKSTIIGLIASFYVPSSGAVRVDEVDLGTVRLDSYRAQLGVVLQETFLFAGSILDNIAFARPGAAREEILAAAASARVDEFANRLEEGYETLIGERGVRLSGGQRQRISIARALLADPRILILDEATSSLDSSSEALIQKALSHLLEGRTTFVIAHRLSTIRRADQILVIDQGRIVERGTHESLRAQGGLYAEMYRTQHEVETNLFLAPGEGDEAVEAPAKVGGARRSAPPPVGDGLAG